MKRPAIAPVPEFALRLLLGESSALVLNSQKVIPEIAIKNKFKFTYSNVESALIDLIK
jgi:NAD dependent epimerase/dehydratase family enzyme